MTLQIDIQKLQSDLPHLLDQVQAGETLVVCKGEEPIAEIRPIDKRRPVGLARGQVEFLPGFGDPLPNDVVEGFEGKAG